MIVSGSSSPNDLGVPYWQPKCGEVRMTFQSESPYLEKWQSELFKCDHEEEKKKKQKCRGQKRVEWHGGGEMYFMWRSLQQVPRHFQDRGKKISHQIQWMQCKKLLMSIVKSESYRQKLYNIGWEAAPLSRGLLKPFSYSDIEAYPQWDFSRFFFLFFFPPFITHGSSWIMATCITCGKAGTTGIPTWSEIGYWCKHLDPPVYAHYAIRRWVRLTKWSYTWVLPSDMQTALL